MRDGQARVSVERLSNLEDWEFYRLVDEDNFSVQCTISVRPHADIGAVEYGVWREKEPEPSLTGTVEAAALREEWSDEAREEVLRSIVYKHESELGVTQAGLEIHLSDDLDDESDEDDEDDYADEEEEDEEGEQSA